jgi:probable rRNA maturation factor
MIEVFFENPHEYPVDLSALEGVISKAFLIHNVTIAQIGVRLVSEAEMTQLNQNFKHHQGATDVLTFVMHDPEQPTPAFLETPETQTQYGDIVLCYDVIAADAEIQGKTPQEHLEFLTEHGALHLLGIHHE